VDAAALAGLIRRCQPCVALTGAGISTESGIPDFRSAEGIWARYDPMEYATIDAFRRDPVKVWDFYARRLGVLAEAEPNAGHLALARLERRGFLQAVITQNVDTLHERAGSVQVVEVHGSIRRHVCPACSAEETLAAVVEQLARRPAPECPGCGSILKPGVVMFGELLPADALARAEELARGASLLLVVGSTLEVWPVAGLPEQTLGGGGSLAIVNRGPTAFDDRARLRVEGGAGEVLAAVADALTVV
jgi:NAD-dependent deacetylase